MSTSVFSPEVRNAFARPKTSVSEGEKRMAREFLMKAMTDTSLPFQTKMGMLHRALLLYPYSGPVLEAYGWELVRMKEMAGDVGFLFLERAFAQETDEPTDPDTTKGQFLCTMLARHFHQQHQYETSKRFLLKAYRSRANNSDLNAVQLATFLSAYPMSVKAATRQLTEFHRYMDIVLRKSSLQMPDYTTADLALLSAFNFELFYEADLRDCMHKYFLIAVKLFPNLLYTSPWLTLNMGKYASVSVSESTCAELAFNEAVTTSRPKIGIASGFFGKNNSVIADFRGVLQRLDRSKYDLLFINIVEKGRPDEFPWGHEPRINVYCMHEDWMDKARKEIGDRQLDVILYLDSTMSSSVQQLMMSKLAKKQAVSHGHPVTSGIPSHIVDYFVSWGAAELPSAQDHYTEQLLLLNPQSMHQYYEHRLQPDGKSAISGEDSMCYTRTYFNTMYNVPMDRRLYTCMQKPFKLHPEFDEMVLSILEKDRRGVVVLHAPDSQEVWDIFRDRLNCFIDRVFFVPALAHHVLMGLYRVSDVVLDSYYAGGCTTTREALEIGAPVVTLPGKYLGGRWSLAYYEIMGYTDLVASSKEQYVQLALAVGPEHKEKILSCVHKLFFQESAVESWSNVLDMMVAAGL